MRKIGFLLIMCLALIVIVTPSASVKAYTSSWQDVEGYSNCEVRVWTDAQNYYEGATSINAYAESNNCPKLYYDMYVMDGTTDAISDIKPGYFSYRTPTKYFNITSNYPYDVYIGVNLYDSPSHNNLVDVYRSEPLFVH
ncbi:hypothetical protein [Thalassobacillus sp. CUG 92003]|uniref:hypothetical protein n=1 Tax=Thalassobacillus sp. CUG 92003 TaxID=2736641 RepID=UPI0015E7AC2B|nr:hypothetical protein [Thalassobacillus sp. CUG 92003]